MNDLFSKLGALAQSATGLSGMPFGQGSGGQQTGGQANPVQNGQAPAGGMGDVLGALKNSVPGGVGGLLGAGALGGILGALLSGGGVGKTVRKLGEGALVVGGTAAAAGLAWKIYQKWSQSQTGAASAGTGFGNADFKNPAGAGSSVSVGGAVFGEPQAGGAVPALTVRAEADPAAMLVLEAMVCAARADGHMDSTERSAVHTTMTHLFPGTDVAASLDSMMNKPLDPEGLAQRVSTPDQAMDLYRLSRMVILVDHAMERAYLDTLASALHIPKAVQADLDEEVAALQRGAA